MYKQMMSPSYWPTIHHFFHISAKSNTCHINKMSILDNSFVSLQEEDQEDSSETWKKEGQKGPDTN